jgi:hypothetical protein
MAFSRFAVGPVRAAELLGSAEGEDALDGFVVCDGAIAGVLPDRIDLGHEGLLQFAGEQPVDRIPCYALHLAGK